MNIWLLVLMTIILVGFTCIFVSESRTIQGVGLVLLTMNAMCMVVMAMGALIGAVFGS